MKICDMIHAPYARPLIDIMARLSSIKIQDRSLCFAAGHILDDVGRAAVPILFLSHSGSDTEAARALKHRIEDSPALPFRRVVLTNVWVTVAASNRPGFRITF
jgi:hypothetical protein